MGKTTYKIGQLVHCSGTAQVDGHFGKIASICDKKSKECFFEKSVVTGNGDKNTMVNIEVDIIANTIGLWSPESELTVLDKIIRRSYDPHNVILIDLSYFEVLYNKALEKMNYKLDFIKKHSVTRDEKIDIILES